MLKNADGFTVKFNDKNPLSFVKPLTISIYFKSANPPVGTYELQGPQGFSGRKNPYRHVFNSQAQRQQPGLSEEQV